MKQITLRLTEEQFETLKSLAKEQRLSISDYLLTKALPNHLQDILTVDKILQRIEGKNVGETFSLRDLFTKNEWENFIQGSRISTGRLFYKNYLNNESGLKDLVEFLGKNSANLAIYKKI